MKSLRKIENYEEFMKIWEINQKNRYWGNKKITKEHEQEIIEKANEKDFKENAIYMFGDGYYFIVELKPSIDRTLWYDDEMSEPKKSLDLFIKHNMSNLRFNFDEWEKQVESLKKDGCCSGKIELEPFFNLNYKDSKEVYLCFYEYFENSRRNQTTIRNLTKDEIDDILEIAHNLKNDYIERLKKYYNKYGMSCCGYWANR